MGPRAGVNGGQWIAICLPEEVMRNPESLTGQYLTGLRQIEVPRIRREGHPGQAIRILGASENNLQNVDAAIPLGTFTCVPGVPRRGNSTPLLQTPSKALAPRLPTTRPNPRTPPPPPRTHNPTT